MFTREVKVIEIDKLSDGTIKYEEQNGDIYLQKKDGVYTESGVKTNIKLIVVDNLYGTATI